MLGLGLRAQSISKFGHGHDEIEVVPNTQKIVDVFLVYVMVLPHLVGQ